MTRATLDPTEGEIYGDDEIPGQGEVPTTWPFDIEIGRTGLRRAAGYLDEEFLRELKGRKGVQVYREMSTNDPIIGALLFALKRLMSQVDWNIEPASSSRDDRANGDFLEQCRDDMKESWSSFVMEGFTSLEYGWAWHEMCWKRRLGPWYENPENGDLHRSRYDDGKIGIAKLPIRAQESFQQWKFGPNDEVIALAQMPAPTYTRRVIPRKKSLLFRPSAHKGNPEGMSILRNAYRPWFYKKRFEETEAVGIERDLAGLPVMHVPAELLGAKPGTDEAKKLAAYKALVKGIRRDERDGVLLPLEYDSKDNKRYEFELLNSGGTRQFDISGTITRLEARMLMVALADFILVGHEGVGTYNMHTDKTGLFRTACDSMLKLFADELNRQLVPSLFRVNGVKPRELPRFVPGSVDAPDLAQLAAFMEGMAQLGVQWFPDPKMEKFVRNVAELPALDPEVEEVLEVQHQQATVMQLAQQRLQALQIGQQAAQGEMALQGQQAGNAQQQLALEGQRRELVKPGSTMPPEKKPVPVRGGGAGRKAGSSNAPQKKAAKR